ncbi:MAG: DUF4105 domain-containing protein [Bacteroidetes bacterium]|nr:MAG: DUF4105 domain-containing protein [Bacteroidota bacterium]
MKYKYLLLVLCWVLHSFEHLHAQVRFSSATKISVLTCQPGNELYSLFGHTAIRLKDTTQLLDVVFNYGTFDFNDPQFYTKFVQGRLPYFVTADDYANFIQLYQYEQRGITEQVLNLPDTAAQAIIQGLLINLQPPNNTYAYHFLYDNCTTRILRWVKTGQPLFITKHTPIVPPNTSFRNLLHKYLDRANHPWEKLGVDFLLGLPCDALVSVEQSMFLPEMLQKGLATSKPNLLAKEQILLRYNTTIATETWLSSPIFILGFVALVWLVLARMASPKIRKVLDASLFTIVGLAGALLVFMWLGTNHDTCKYNFNLLWANPLFLLWWFSNKTRRFSSIALSVVLMLTLAGWWWLPQQMNSGFLPIVVLLLSRSIFYATHPK